MATDFDALVFDAISGHTPGSPQDLVGILGSVDGREKLVLSHEELSLALKRLTEAGKIAESERHHFHELGDGDEPGTFSGLSPAEHDAACERYREEFWRKYRELK
jgi:hypothetical protein